MKTKKFIKAFEGMSKEDQAAIRTAIEEIWTPASSCCSETETGQLKEMMAQMEGSGHMASMCQDMMRMCKEKMTAKSCG